jgi:flagellin-like protein
MCANIRREKAPNKRSRRALSPVIATVILVAIAITVSVAVAYWMGGIAGTFTTFEQVEIQNAVCSQDAYDNWVVTLTLKNTGTAQTTLISLFANDVEATPDASAPTAAVDTLTTNLNITSSTTLPSGVTATILVWVGRDYGTLSSGTTVNFKLHSTGGMDYLKLITLV